MSKSEEYDLIVIGGGSGGIAAARRAAEYGARVVLFEAARLGGTCVNVGCVPKKVMWNAAQVGDAIALAGDYGFDVAARGFDWHKLKCARDDYVARLNEIYAANLHASKVKCITATAKFCGHDSVASRRQNLPRTAPINRQRRTPRPCQKFAAPNSA